MKTKNIILLAVIAIFMVALGVNFSQNASVYTDFATAKESGKKVHIVGEWVQREDAFYIAEQDLFSFFMKDTMDVVQQVIYRDPKPINFETAEKVVVIGGYNEQEMFVADKIIMKCPSKYEETDITAAEEKTL